MNKLNKWTSCDTTHSMHHMFFFKKKRCVMNAVCMHSAFFLFFFEKIFWCALICMAIQCRFQFKNGFCCVQWINSIYFDVVWDVCMSVKNQKFISLSNQDDVNTRLHAIPTPIENFVKKIRKKRCDVNARCCATRCFFSEKIFVNTCHVHEKNPSNVVFIRNIHLDVCT